MRILPLATLAFAAVALSCSARDDITLTTAELSANYVTVELRLELDDDGSGTLSAKFTPDDDGWHLYATEMSMDGVDGIGRPTRLDLIAGAQTSGPITTSAIPYDLAIATLDIVVPVYPDGPVTLAQEVTAARDTVEVELTFMSCSEDGGCRSPVVNRRVSLDLP